MINIRKIDADNVFDICELTSNDNGIGTLFEGFICCNAISIAESKFYLECKPRAIYLNEVPIGFYMYKQWPHQSKDVELCRFMLHFSFKGKGLGRQSFSAMLEDFRTSGVREVTLMIDKDNRIAKKLYLSFGFAFTGKIEKEEYFYSLTL